jgi:formylglycine-generating enzyme required for sulfatase activity
MSRGRRAPVALAALGLGSAACLLPGDFEKVDARTTPPPAMPPAAESCKDIGNAVPDACGPEADDDCCATLYVPGGTFLRGYDRVTATATGFEATVSPFYLDKYEVTVGRFRAFVQSGEYPPAPKSGAHPKVEGTGWLPAWSTEWLTGPLPDDGPGFNVWYDDTCPTLRTWTPSPGAAATEILPINCIPWDMAFAFCVWDGGRLASEAEWHFAASGGDEQRVYPWSVPPDDSISPDRAVYGCSDAAGAFSCPPESRITAPGSRLDSGGAGRWGHADLAGNLYEWLLDSERWTVDSEPNPVASYNTPCVDCVSLDDAGMAPEHRVIRGGNYFSGAADLRAVNHGSFPATTTGLAGVGIRCARDVPSP